MNLISVSTRFRTVSALLAGFFLTSALGVAHSQGVGVVDAVAGDYLMLTSNEVRVSVESQVAIVTTTEEFVSVEQSPVNVKYAFPMPEGGSATSLRWKINGIWHDAIFSPTPQDTTFGGTGDPIDAALTDHIGPTPGAQ